MAVLIKSFPRRAEEKWRFMLSKMGYKVESTLPHELLRILIDLNCYRAFLPFPVLIKYLAVLLRSKTFCWRERAVVTKDLRFVVHPLQSERLNKTKI